jgi:hypothetical protein
MKSERGFAMLFVFVMAAAVAIILYRDLPRVAFEAQRNREDVLIARGEQYTRAIQLYVRKFKKYPGKIEDLEETNQIRFLRKRYIDPLTGKSEWRMIHMGPGGVFTDSLTHKPPSKDKEETKAVNTFTYEAPPVGSTLPQNGQTDPAFPQGRPSERAGFRLPGQQGQPGDPANPQQQPAGFVAGVGFQGQPQTGVNPLQRVPGMPPGLNPQQAYPGAPVNSQTGGVAPSFPYSTQPGVQGAPQQFPQPGVNFNPLAPPQQPGQNQALNLINQILTTPGRAVSRAEPTSRWRECRSVEASPGWPVRWSERESRFITRSRNTTSGNLSTTSPKTPRAWRGRRALRARRSRSKGLRRSPVSRRRLRRCHRHTPACRRAVTNRQWCSSSNSSRHGYSRSPSNRNLRLRRRLLLLRNRSALRRAP